MAAGVRVAASVIGVSTLLAGVAGVWALHSLGPQFGVYLVKPSPQRYADIALDLMENGYYAAGPEWAAQRAEVEAKAEGATSMGELHAPLAAAVEAAGGKHSFLLEPTEVELWSISALDEFSAPTVTTADGITTVTVPAVGAVSEEMQRHYARTAASGIVDAADQTCGWIIDLRGNTGGTMYPMLSGMTPLLPNGTAMTFRTRTGADTPVTIYEDGAGIGRTAISVGVVTKIADQPVAVLQDAEMASSGEVVLASFRGLDNIRSFGTNSAGYTSANSARPLFDGALLVLTESLYVDRNGMSLAEVPILPDYVTSPENAEETARAWLQDRGCN